MADTHPTAVDRQLSESAIDDQLRRTDDSARLRRLVFIKNLYQGDSVEEASNRVGRSRSTGYRWLNRWNDGGIDAMVPDTSSGRPPKLSAAQNREFRSLIREHEPCRTETIRQLLASEFDVEYAPAYLPRVLRELGCTYTAPALEQTRDAETVTQIDWDDKDHGRVTKRHPYDERRNRPVGYWTTTTG